MSLQPKLEFLYDPRVRRDRDPTQLHEWPMPEFAPIAINGGPDLSDREIDWAFRRVSFGPALTQYEFRFSWVRDTRWPRAAINVYLDGKVVDRDHGGLPQSLRHTFQFPVIEFMNVDWAVELLRRCVERFLKHELREGWFVDGNRADDPHRRRVP